MTTVGNAKVYQFLARTGGKDWQKQADQNKDGIVSYNEFQTFVSSYSGNMDGELLSTADMNEFWKTVNTDTLDFNLRGTKVSGVNNLNADEIAAMNDDLEDYIALEKIYSKAIGLNPFTKNGSSAEFSKSWNSTVNALFLVIQFLSSSSSLA